MGEGLVRNTAKIKDSAVSVCSPPDKQRQHRRLLARRIGQDFEAGFQRIVGFDQLQFRLAAAEQRGEELAEFLIHRAEGVEQALAAFAVEAGNAAAQLGDRLDEIVALPDQAVELLGHRFGLFLGAEIDAAETLAVVAEAEQACVRSHRAGGSCR